MPPIQSAFVSERLISDNILIHHKIVHSLGTNYALAKAFMAIKSDMSKIYNMVKWLFLEELMKAIGFDSKWISWIMVCVKFVS